MKEQKFGEELTTEGLIDEILSSTKYLEKFNVKDPSDVSRLENIKELKSVAQNFPNITEFLEQIALVESEYFESEKRGGNKQGVHLMTLHQAKGLEFPIVFCPFLHASSRIAPAKDEPIFYHSDDDHLVLDLGSEELQNKKIVAEKEILGENLRLMYVALTRAKHRCYMTWGKIKDADTSAPAYIFHLPQADDSFSILEQMEERFKKFSTPRGEKNLAVELVGSV
jgi:ATP-dependent exoDNAse (exonuclease V) beta subunit